MSSSPIDHDSSDRPERPPADASLSVLPPSTNTDANGTTAVDLTPPPYASRAILSVVGADRGLNIAHIENGLIINFERWINLNVGDVFEYYMGDTRFPKAEDQIRPGQETQVRYQLAIPYEEVPTGFVFPCFGRVVRALGGAESTSVEQTFFIKDTRPGGDDTDPGLPYHSELKLHLPPDLQGPDAVLEPDRASSGLLFPIDRYPNIRVRDTLELEYGNQTVLLQIDADQAEGRTPIEVFVSERIIERAGSGLIAIRFRAYDEVDNVSGKIRQWSQTSHLKADLDTTLLERPYFLVERVDTTDVNFDTQGEKIFELEVVVPSVLPNGTRTPAGAQIVATLNAIQFDGSPLVETLPPFPAMLNRSAFTVVRNDIVKQLINGSMLITYEVQFPLGTVLGTSRGLTVTVFGTQANMPAVTIREAEVGLIDPAAPYITVDFPEYTPYSPNFPVTLRMEAIRPGGGVEFYEQTLLAGAPPPPTRFRIVPNSEFQRFVGLGHVRVFYRVDDGRIGPTEIDALTIRDSEDLFVQFGDRVEIMPRPLMQGVDLDDNLDPNDVIGQAIVTLPYVNTLPGDTLVWRWQGSAGGPESSTGGSILLNEASAGAAVAFTVDKSYVDANLDHEIRLSYSLVRPGAEPLRSEVLVVTVGRPLGDLLPPTVREADPDLDQLMPERVTAGATIVVYFPQMLPTDRIRAEWNGLAFIGSHSETKDGSADMRVEFRVPPEVIGANIHPAGRNITVQYFLLRRTREIPSQPLVLHLLPLIDTPTPTIEGVGDNPILETFRLAGNERTVIDRWDFSQRDQRMWMDYEGEYADGRRYYEQTYSAELVTAAGETQGVSPPTPVNELRRLRDGSQLTTRFWVSFDRGQFKSEALMFRERHYYIQTLPSILPHPVLQGASGTGPNVTVEPLAVENNVRVTVRYDDMRSDDLITLKWVYQDATVHRITLSGLATGTRVFPIDNKIMALSINSTIQLSYSVVRTGIPGATPSHVQTVRVGTITSLPRPLIHNVPHTSILDVPTLPGSALLTVAQWPYVYTGMNLWLTLHCPGASPATLVIWAAHPHNEAAGVSIPAPLDWLATCPNGEQISIQFKVGYVTHATEAQAISAPVTLYTVRNTVLALAITGAADAVGNLIANGGSAATSTVTLTGTASPVPQSPFDIYDGDLLITSVPAGQSPWSVVVTGVALGERRYTARGRQGNPRPTSNLWRFNNLSVVTPTITVRDSRGEVPHQGTTTNTSVTVSGKATPGLQVRLWEGGAPISGPLTVSPGGDWSYVMSGLTTRTYSVHVKALYANVESNTRTFTVGAATPPLTINQTNMHLNGYAIVAQGWVRNAQDYPGNAQTRTPTGGVLPYTYSSRNSGIASVTQAGKVTGNRNGSTTIDVRDNLGSTVSYNVSVSNVWHLRVRNAESDYNGAIAWRNSLPGAIAMGASALSHMSTVYGTVQSFPLNQYGYWCCLEGGCGGFLPEGIMYYGRDSARVWCRLRSYAYSAFCLQP
jgi:hypothetical protein